MVECDLAKVDVAGSSPVSRSILSSIPRLPEPSVFVSHGSPMVGIELRYDAPGSPALAARTTQALAHGGQPAQLDPQRGWDHGVWVPLRFLCPAARVPVVEVSIPLTLAPAELNSLGELLRPFRQDLDALFDYARTAPHASRAVPTPEHFVPVFVTIGRQRRTRPSIISMKAFSMETSRCDRSLSPDSDRPLHVARQRHHFHRLEEIPADISLPPAISQARGTGVVVVILVPVFSPGR